MAISTNDVLGNMGGDDYSVDHAVFLNFASRKGKSVENEASSVTNRIMLKCESVTISTNRNIPSFPIPFSGLIRGESTNIAIDLGIASKSVQLNGVITDQIISKQKGTETPKNVSMTASEIAQLIHSSVDSSFLQDMQNLNELIILYPSRVGNNYNYHAGNDADGVPFDENTKHALLPLVPFTWASRTLDESGTFGASNYPSPNDEYTGITGFISQFGCEFVGGQIITFNLSFTESIVASGSAIKKAVGVE